MIKNYDQKQLGEQRFHFSLSQSHSILSGSQGRNLGSETEAETVELCLLAALHGLLSVFSYTIQDRLPKRGTTHSELCLPTIIVIEENALKVCPWTIGYRYFLNWGFASQIILIYVKLTKKQAKDKTHILAHILGKAPNPSVFC